MKIYSTTQSTLTATMDSCIQNDPWVRTGMALGIVGCTVHRPPMKKGPEGALHNETCAHSGAK